MAEFVLEIGTEEMPARFLPKLEQDLAQGLETALRDAHIDFNGIETFSTPRRFVVRAQGVAPAQRETEAVVSGPSISVAYDASGNPTKAALGFAKGQGMEAADLFRLQTDKGEYVAVRKKSGSEQTVSLLPAMCRNLVSSLAFPKRMRWGDRDFSFGRPIRWLLALLDETALDFEVGRIRSGRETLGHRVLGFGPWPVASARSLFGVLREKAKVVLDSKERKKTIIDQGNALAAAVRGRVVWNESLLGEVSGLVESPKPILANFDPAFLEVPREVLLTSMQSHQKSFGVEDADGNLLPHFLSTLNLESKDEALVRKGWERVLKARLEDARFFWRTDLSREFDRWLATLDNVVFLGPWAAWGINPAAWRPCAVGWRNSFKNLNWRLQPPGRAGWPRPIWFPTWWVNSLNCKGSWAASTPVARAKGMSWPGPCTSTICLWGRTAALRKPLWARWCPSRIRPTPWRAASV